MPKITEEQENELDNRQWDCLVSLIGNHITTKAELEEYMTLTVE